MQREINSIRAVVITVSDRSARGERVDESGPVLQTLLKEAGAEIVAAEIIADDVEPLREMLLSYTERDDVDLIITTGGTGFAERDHTPEATRAVIDREAPGLAEAMRFETSRQTPTALLSRGVCGLRSGTLIVNLPGSPKAVRECFAVIKPVLPHAVRLLRDAGDDHHPSAKL